MNISEGILLVAWAVGFGMVIEVIEDVQDQYNAVLIIITAALWPLFLLIFGFEVAQGRRKLPLKLVGRLVVIFAAWAALSAWVR